MLAIIGGSGLSKLGNMEVTRRKVSRTPYGEPSGALSFGHIGGCDVVFLARHGYGHTIAPHEVNYRANLWALKDAGAAEVVSVASVGAIADHPPGALVIPDQIIDYTWGRTSTYFEGAEQPVTHIDFTEPYDADTRQMAISAAQAAGVPVVDGGTYAATQGPRLETKAEIDRLEGDGATMVGMTGMPEAALARELGLCYAAIAIVVNYAAGRAESAEAVHLADINAVSRQSIARVHRILDQLVLLDGH
jgi:5'-methylthioinosine phosphorylase